MLAVGVAAVAAALLILTLAVLPAGPGRVPLSRLDPTVAPPTSALAGAGAAAGAVVQKVLVKRGRLAAGAAALERAGMTVGLPDFVLAVGLTALGAGAVGTVLGGPLLGLAGLVLVPLGSKVYVALRT